MGMGVVPAPSTVMDTKATIKGPEKKHKLVQHTLFAPTPQPNLGCPHKNICASFPG